ncbi:MAG: hypothetical protein WC570_04530 [Patescibacteria group bacterium]
MIIKKIKKYILEGEYEIKFVKNFRRFQGIPVKGFIEPDNNKILINNNLSHQEKITTIIHEFLHEIFPQWSENKVEKECRKLYHQMSSSDIHFFDKLI